MNEKLLRFLVIPVKNTFGIFGKLNDVALLQSKDPVTTFPSLPISLVDSTPERKESLPYNPTFNAFGAPPKVSKLFKNASTELSGFSPTPVVNSPTPKTQESLPSQKSLSNCPSALINPPPKFPSLEIKEKT